MESFLEDNNMRITAMQLPSLAFWEGWWNTLTILIGEMIIQIQQLLLL